MKPLIRIIAILFAWLFLSAGTLFVSCSSDGDNDPRDDVLNRPPEAFGSTLLTVVDVEITSVLRAVDPDGDALTYRIVSDPSLGFVRLTDADNGTYIYISNVIGTDSFEFKANDGRLDSNAATVTVQIRNTIPNWRPITGEIEGEESSEWLRDQSAPTKAAPSVVVLDTSAVGRGAGDGDRNTHATDPFDSERQLSVGEDGVYLSTDRGISRRAVGLNPPLREGDRVAVMAFSPYTPSLAYLLFHRDEGNRMYRSTDAGSSWDLVSTGPEGSITGFAIGPLGTDGGVRLVLRLHNQPDLYKSTDYPYL